MSQSARLVQSGEGDRRFVVLLYLIHPDRDPALREALGPKPMILARVDDGDPGPGIGEELLRAHVIPADPQPDFPQLAGLVLGGWSAGCSGVRKRLLERNPAMIPPMIRALVLADGTHASLPPQPWQLDVWRPWIEKARASGTTETYAIDENTTNVARLRDGLVHPSFVFAASHTYQTYVEQLPGGKAYTSTVNVLQALTGWRLDQGQHWPFGYRTAEHDLHVESWASAAIDGPAHIRQQTEALPGMLARYVRPMVEAAG